MILDNLTDEEKYFASRVREYFKEAANGGRVRFVGFLDGRRQEIAKEIAARERYGKYMLYGGYDGSERKYLGVFPEYMDGDAESFPITVLTLTFRKEESLSHRDFLGAVLGLGIKRECVGDILVGEDRCVIFLSDAVGELVKSELEKVGRAGVKVEEGIVGELPEGARYEEISATAASARLDCIIALLLNVSREKSAQIIKSGAVAVNFEEIKRVADEVCDGDIISVRASGRYVIDSVGEQTKKGRIKVKARKNK